MANRQKFKTTDMQVVPLKWLIIGGSLVTLIFWTNLNDPFNAPKSWILSISGFWLFGWLVFHVKEQWKSKFGKWQTLLASAYLLAMSASFLATDNKFIGLFGAYQRRTGYLSYFCLISFFLAASYLFDLKKLALVEKAILVIGFLTSIYALAQHFKHDFVHWNNPYNSVLGTLGNPDFAAATMAIFAVLNFGIAINGKYSKWIRILGIFNFIMLVVAIVFSQVRQGLLAAVFGVAMVTIVWIHQRNKFVAYFGISLAFIVGSLGIIGMLDRGPLSRYFYRPSVTFRGDYWRAGWQMFIHHPLFGVGLDRFGANFRLYRDATQSLRRGPGVTSDAAHNVPIQLASTGGIFVLLTFLLLVSYIFWRGLVGLRKTQGAEQITVAVFFAAWLAYQAQSLISIDNLGIAIWGYILGGIVVGISIDPQTRPVLPLKISLVQPFFSGGLALVAVIFSIFFFSAESAMKTFNGQAIPNSPANLSEYEALSQKPISYLFKEPAFYTSISGKLAGAGDFNAAVNYLTKQNESDHLNFESRDLLARIYEYKKDWSHAVLLREEIVKIDPVNYVNLLQLGEDYKSLGNLSEAKKVTHLIESFASTTSQAKQAIKDFGN